MRVSLFVTCLVDQLFPSVAEATVAVLRRCGVDVEFASDQTCCGQIAFNDGFWPESRTLARRHLDIFEQADAVVVPSGSCGAMVREFYPVLFREDAVQVERARRVGHRTYELSEFLINVLGRADVGARFHHRVTYHASCHGLRGLGVRDQPVQLLSQVRDLELRPLRGLEECCGFGGMFAVKFAALSGAMLDAKIKAIEASGAEFVTATDASCLMHIDGGLRRKESSIRTLHLAEILASQ
ncbi:MAG: (Fe-S)-binding protein [Armatimonadetes bacterium]|nr:(Fe-S)-binding protein [Armatimonadota bacterium]